jgi:hypothetical protein
VSDIGTVSRFGYWKLTARPPGSRLRRAVFLRSSGAGTARFEVRVNPEVPLLQRSRLVCENHPHMAWSDEAGCQCGAGMPCKCNRADVLEKPDVNDVMSAQRS